MYDINDTANTINGVLLALTTVSMPLAGISVYGFFHSDLTFKKILKNVKEIILKEKFPDIIKDMELEQELEEAVRLAQGEERYSKLCRIAKAKALNGNGLIVRQTGHSGLPFIAVSYIPCDEAEKKFLENELKQYIKAALEKRKFCSDILISDTTNCIVGLPAIEFRFATNEEEKEILIKTLDSEANRILGDILPPQDSDLNNILNNFKGKNN